MIIVCSVPQLWAWMARFFIILFTSLTFLLAPRDVKKNVKGDFCVTCVPKPYDNWIWAVRCKKLHFTKIKKFGRFYSMYLYEILQLLGFWLGSYSCRWANFCNFGIFLLFLSLLHAGKIESLKDEKKTGDNLILHMRTKYYKHWMCEWMIMVAKWQ